MVNVVGESVVGEHFDVEVDVSEPQYAFMYGRAPEIGSTPVFIHAFRHWIESFAIPSYIEGADNAHNNEESSWGSEAQAEAEIAAVGGSEIVNIYEPKYLYMNGYITSLASTGRRAYIVSKALLMDVPTQDGKENPYANRAVDYLSLIHI